MSKTRLYHTIDANTHSHIHTLSHTAHMHTRHTHTHSCSHTTLTHMHSHTLSHTHTLPLPLSSRSSHAISSVLCSVCTASLAPGEGTLGMASKAGDTLGKHPALPADLPCRQPYLEGRSQLGPRTTSSRHLRTSLPAGPRSDPHGTPTPTCGQSPVGLSQVRRAVWRHFLRRAFSCALPGPPSGHPAAVWPLRAHFGLPSAFSLALRTVKQTFPFSLFSSPLPSAAQEIGCALN